MNSAVALRLLILSVLILSAIRVTTAQPIGRAGTPSESPYDHHLFTAPAHEMPAQPFDLEHLRVSLRVEMDGGRVFGVATYRMRLVEDSLPVLPFRAESIEVFSVRVGMLDGDKLGANFTFAGTDTLLVDLDSLAQADGPIEVQITYAATPARGLYLHRPAGSRSPNLVWTDAMPESHRFWLPLPFSPADLITSEVLVSVPSDMEALSNGLLTETMPTEDGLVQFHFVQDQQHPTYAIGLVVGRFYKYEQSVRLYNGYTVPFAQWVAEERTEDVARTFQDTGSILNFLSARFGVVYPWPRYTQVLANDLLIDTLDFTSYTLFNDRFLLDERAMLDESPTLSLATALAHQWVGAMLPPDYWSDAWIAPGLSTYIGLLYLKERDGDEAFYAGLHRLAERYFDEAAEYRRPLVWNQWEQPAQLIDAHARAKGAWVFHSIYQQLGDESFWGFLQAFHRARAFTAVNADMLKQSLTTWFKTSFESYFDQWVFSAGHPELNVRYRYDPVAESLYVNLSQTQDGYLVPGDFDLSLDLEVHTLGSSQRFTLAVTQAEHVASFALPLAPRFVLVDPDHRYLMRVAVDQTLTAWVAQLRFAPNPLDRLAAVDALGALRSDPALAIGLQPAVLSRPPEDVYAAIVSLLAELPPSENGDRMLMNAFEEESPRIRQAVLEGLARRSETADVTIMALETAETAMSYSLQASAVSILAAVRAPSAENIVRSALITPSHAERVRLAGLNAIPYVGISTREGVQLASSYTSANQPAELRVGAIRLLAFYARMDNKTAANTIASLIDDPSPLIRTAARIALETLGADGDEETLHLRLSMPHLRSEARLTP
jgi:aminopeptidase N